MWAFIKQNKFKGLFLLALLPLVSLVAIVGTLYLGAKYKITSNPKGFTKQVGQNFGRMFGLSLASLFVSTIISPIAIAAVTIVLPFYGITVLGKGCTKLVKAIIRRNQKKSTLSINHVVNNVSDESVTKQKPKSANQACSAELSQVYSNELILFARRLSGGRDSFVPLQSKGEKAPSLTIKPRLK